MATTKKTKKTPAAKQTNVIFIIDESGSMSTAAKDVRGGFNSYVEKLKGDGNKYSLTAIKFGTRVRPLFANLSLKEVPQLDEKNYTPMDTTALYDAIGHGFSVAKESWSTPDKPFGENPVIMIIMTDGFENASREYKKEHVVEGIKEREAAKNWTFVYLGADQDAWSIAGDLGISQGNTMSYASDNTSRTFDNVAHATARASRGGSGQTFSFFDGGN
jgi:hypothetical protein